MENATDKGDKIMAKIAKVSSGVLNNEERTQIIQDLAAFADQFSPDADEQPDSPETKDEQQAYKRMTGRNRRVNRMTKHEVEAMLDVMLDNKGRPSGFKNGVHNATIILNNDPKIAGAIAYDLVADQVVIRRSISFGVDNVPSIFVRTEGQDYNRSHEAALAAYLGAPTAAGGYGIAVSGAVMEMAVLNAAMMNAFDPLVDDILATEWDRQPRLDTAFVRWFHMRDDAYARQVAQCFLISFIERRFKPGSKFDYVPVLVGRKQGTFKSTVIEVLSLGRFGEFRTPQEISDPKKMNEATDGAAIMEVPELSALMTLHHNTIKSTFSSRKDRARAAFAKHAETRMRSWLAIGTTNDTEFLKDPTGNRRFWPIFLNDRLDQPVDIEAMRSEIRQVYAEALWRYRQMRKAQTEGDLPLFLMGEAAAIAKQLQERAAVTTPEQAVAGWLVEWLITEDHSKFADIEIGGKTYRSKFCLREAHDAYHAAFSRDSKVAYDAAATKLMSGAVAMISGVSKGGSARFAEYGVQGSYAVDPEWLKAEICGEPQPVKKPKADAESKPENVVHIQDHEDFVPW